MVTCCWLAGWTAGCLALATDFKFKYAHVVSEYVVLLCSAQDPGAAACGLVGWLAGRLVLAGCLAGWLGG